MLFFSFDLVITNPLLELETEESDGIGYDLESAGSLQAGPRVSSVAVSTNVEDLLVDFGPSISIRPTKGAR